MAEGVFAPGHPGELIQIVPFEMIDAVLAECGAVQPRLFETPGASQSWPELCIEVVRPGQVSGSDRASVMPKPGVSGGQLTRWLCAMAVIVPGRSGEL
ncbi:hypothetical protein [Streptomyces goshikiensis]|uniref:hypothetical protein n=1 Tax=Streptomyces goshikiensis TaxID=1942 RepID=UPI0036B1097F